MNLEELRAKQSTLAEELQGYDLDGDITDEQLDEIEAKTTELDSVNAEIKKLETKDEKRQKIKAQLTRQNTGGGDVGGEDDPTSLSAVKVTVPARARARGQLKAFEDEKTAYISGHCIAANLFGNTASKKWLDDHGIYGTAFSENDDQKGGLFVPTEMETAIIRLVEQFGVFRRFAQRSPMGSDRKIVPVRTSGLTAYPVGESDANAQPTGTASSADYKSIELVARKWKVRTKVSDELDEDSLISIAEQVTLESAQAFAESEDDAGFNGDGTNGSYHGIVGLANKLAAGSTLDLDSGEQAFSDVTLADCEELMGMLPMFPGIQPRWYISKPGYHASLLGLINAAGGQSATERREGGDLMFLGYPVTFSQKMTTQLTDHSSNTYLMYFGDLGMAALFGDRRGMTMSTDRSVHWDEDMIGIKSTERFDINVHSAGDASNAGAIVGMKTQT